MSDTSTKDTNEGAVSTDVAAMSEPELTAAEQAALELAPPEPALPTFDLLPLSAELRETLNDMGYQHPTPVQLAVWEPATRGRDAVVQARTGTGKTAAFGLPIVDHVVKRSVLAAQVLVLCPTRELALQVSGEIGRLGKRKETKVLAIYGGAPIERQVQGIDAGAQVIVGTPGRVLDHIRRGTLKTTSVRLLVLDEADEMLSMGFERELTAILDTLPPTRQTLLFSATVPPDIERISKNKLKNPEFVTLSGDHIGALSIQHFVYMVPSDKLRALGQIIEVENPESAVIFCNTKDDTQIVANSLQARGYDADWLNGDLAQSERERVMSATREGRLRFLVATDVAARGIDISHLTHVINYDFPQDAESYVHRTGRTGRAGRTGTAIALITPRDIGGLYLLRLTYKIKPIERQIPTPGELKTRAEADLVSMFAEAYLPKGIHADDRALARRLLNHDFAEAIVAGLLRDVLGARPNVQDEASSARRATVRRGSFRSHRDGSGRGRPDAGRGPVGSASGSVSSSVSGASEGAPVAAARPAVVQATTDIPAARNLQPAASTGVGAVISMIPAGVAAQTTSLVATAPRGFVPSGFAPSGVAPSGVATSGVAPSSVATSGVATSGVATSGVATSGVATSDPTIEGTGSSPLTTLDPRERDEARGPGERRRRTTPGALPDAPRPERGERDRPERSDRAERGPRPERDARAREPRPDRPRPLTGPQRDAAAPRSDDSERETKRRPVPVTEFANWQPPAEEGDDEPLLGPRGREERGREEGASPQSARSATHTASASAGSSGAQQREGQLYNAPVAESGEPEGDPADHAELFVTVGRRDGIRAQDLLRVLVEVAGLDKHTIRRIRVRDRHAFISVRKADAATAIAKLHGTALAGRTLTVEVARERSGEMQEGSPES